MKQTKEEELKAKIKDLEDQTEPLKKELREIWNKKEDEIKAKLERTLKGKDAFSLKELRFAATSKCPCGAGLAYPKEGGVFGSWECSDILRGLAIPANQAGSKEHTQGLPFAFYEIKSEDQPSANGMTTRPKEDQSNAE